MAISLNDVLSSSRLPSLPGIALRIVELSRRLDTDLNELVCLIRSDPAIASKVLRTVNSSLFGLRHRVATIEQAVALLGNTPLSGLILSFSLLPKTTSKGPLASRFHWLWRSSLTQAVAAEELARLNSEATPSEFFVAGLLQDVGALALLRSVPDEYLTVMEEFDLSGRQLAEVEQIHLGITHLEVGSEMVRRWRLPEHIQEAVAHHHSRPPNFDRPPESRNWSMRRALAVAAAIADYASCAKKYRAHGLVQDYLRQFYALVGDAQDALLECIISRVQSTVELFASDTGDSMSYEEILAAARAELVDLASRVLYDPLTQIAGGTDFSATLAQYSSLASSSGQSLAVLVLDLDNFRSLNEQCGTIMGDKVLKSVARVLASLASNFTALTRSGADEFAMLMLGVDEARLRDIAELLRRSVAAYVVTYGSEDQ